MEECDKGSVTPLAGNVKTPTVKRQNPSSLLHRARRFSTAFANLSDGYNTAGKRSNREDEARSIYKQQSMTNATSFQKINNYGEFCRMFRGLDSDGVELLSTFVCRIVIYIRM